MSVNTENKQRSVFGLDGPMFVIFPVPDSAPFDEADLRHLAGHYRFEDTRIRMAVVVSDVAAYTVTVSDTLP